MSTKKMTILSRGLISGETGKDPIRDLFGEWTHRGRQPFYKKNLKYKGLRVRGLKKASSISNSTFDEGSPNYSEFYAFGEVYEIGMPWDPSTQSSPSAGHLELLTLLNNTVNSGEVYEDFATEVRVPTTKAPNSEKSARVGYEYIYLDKNYEDVLGNFAPNITAIPSMYSMAAKANTSTLVENALQAATVKQLNWNIRHPKTRMKFRNQMVVGDPAKTIGTWEDSKFLFPMYCDIRVPTGIYRSIARGLQETDLAACFMRDLSEATGRGNDNLSSPLKQKTVLASRRNSGITAFVERTGGRTKRYLLSSDSIDMVQYWKRDLGAWATVKGNRLPKGAMFISENFSPPQTPAAMADAPFSAGVYDYGDTSNQEILATPKGLQYTALLSLATETMRGKIDLLLEEHARRWGAITQKGEKAYSEILMYKITKTLGTNTSRPAQTFYFYNDGEDEEDTQGKIISFIDTQVKYNQEYTYAVTAYLAVVGSKYRYEKITDVPIGWTYDPTEEAYRTTQESNISWVRIKVKTEPTIKLFEIPIFSSTGRIAAPPPLSPQVSIEQIKGAPRTMLFSFDTQVGETYEEPVSFSVREEQINNQHLSDSRKSSDGKILYRSTEGISGIQVFRISTPPEDYYDFKGNMLRSISTDVDTKSSMTSAAISKRISQTPNKKFYYMFRATEYHGETSNPSPVYEVELYSDGGVSYPIVRLYEFNEKSSKTFSKPMRNLIRIRPKMSQAMLNEKASGLISEDGERKNAFRKNIVLGIEDESLFGNTEFPGKTFKVRLTSRDTGKKIDINMTFKTKDVWAPPPPNTSPNTSPSHAETEGAFHPDEQPGEQEHDYDEI
jgi:hypothetical protein